MDPQHDTCNPPSRVTTAILVAMTRDRVIGSGNRLPWHIPEELALFRRLTLGKTVVMGHNTLRSIGGPLPDRNNIVLAHQPFDIEGVIFCDSFEGGWTTALRLEQPVFFIGGVSIYRQALTFVERLHISWINGEYAGDRYFPDFNLEDWQAVSRQIHQEFVHTCYQRRTRRD